MNRMLVPLAFIAWLALTVSAHPHSTDDGNCGARCLYVAAVAMGVEASNYVDFMDRHSWSRSEQCSLRDLAEAAGEYNVSSQLVEFRPNDIPAFDGCLIAHVAEGHFVILRRQYKHQGSLSWCDPPHQSIIATSNKLSQLTGSGLLIGEMQEGSSKKTILLIFMLIAAATVPYVLRLRLRRND